MPYRVYDGYGSWTEQPDTIYDGYGSWIRNPALPPEYDGYGGFWNKETDPNWIAPPAPEASPPVAAPAPEPAPAPVAPPIVAPAAAAPAAPAAPAVDPNAPLGPAISAGSPISSGSKLQTTTGDQLAATLLAPPSNWDAQGKQKASNTQGSLSISK